MKRVNKKLAAGIVMLSQTLSGAAFAGSVTLAGLAAELKLTMQELNHEFN